MATDMRMHIEIKVDDQWYYYNRPDVGRDYRLFTKMAGVRDVDRIEPIVPPRGLPKDATFMTTYTFEHRKVDSFAMSWLSSAEVVVLRDWMKDGRYTAPFPFTDQFGYLFGNSFDWFAKHGADGRTHPPGLEDFRFIFWFD